MSLEKGISRIGHVLGKLAGIAFGIMVGGNLTIYLQDQSRWTNFGVSDDLLMLGSAIVGFSVGYILGYMLFVWLTKTVNWVIEGFR